MSSLNDFSTKEDTKEISLPVEEQLEIRNFEAQTTLDNSTLPTSTTSVQNFTQPIYNTVPISKANSFGIAKNTAETSNFDSFSHSVIDQSNNQQNFGLLNLKIQSNQFDSTPISSTTPVSVITSNSIPLMQPNVTSTVLPQSVSMTPQLSVNSQIGLNDTLSSPEISNGAFPIATTNFGAEISNVPSRTVYLGNIPNGISSHELFNHIRSGTVESLKLIPSKNCAFVSFLDEKSATLFHSDAILKRLTINNHEIKIGWGKPSPLSPVVASCVQRYNATRNVYIGNLSPLTTEEVLQNDCVEFGEIDTIKILREKKIAFVHFTTVLAAIKCVQSLPLVDKYKEHKIFYGKDRCAFITKTQQHNAAQYLGLNPNSENFVNQVDRDLIANALVQQSNAAAMIATSTGGTSNLGNRTIYLGNLHPDSTIEEICNVVRGGILQNIRLISERHVCFLTFIDPISAAQFYAMSSLHGLIIHNRKIKVGWGKHSGPLPNSINLAVGNGASRNIYIGGLDKINDISFSKDKLFNDFKEFGEIEQINFYEERHCCFVNFTNISNAIKAIDGIRNNPDYRRCKINFGKDRCGNTPRQVQVNKGTPGNNNINQINDINKLDNYHSNNNQNTVSSNINSNLSSELESNSLNFNLLNINDKPNIVESDSDSEEDDSVDEAKVRFQPLGITLDTSKN
ncbi:hypothetical protein CANINC_004305 [Pichia inconspicua]|uniref:RRM domain-containing protein n=1 Tax=Pichia inconspicua TaxID=52247 RepID=A0A4T0WWK5_9ASCO|nr:hypothetical protein CANINC_004305 [[Candida] inconspicua]